MSTSEDRSIVRTPLLQESPLDRYRGVTGRRQLHQHAVLITEGEGDSASGFVAVFGPLQVPDFLTLTNAFFAGREYEVAVESDTASVVETYLVSESWTCIEEETAMVLPRIPDAPPPPPSLTIASVSSSETYEDYMQVVPGNRAWVPSLDAATDSRVGLFVGYVGGIPVATARLASYGDVAEITGVQTLQEHRRRGYGRAMTWAAVKEAKRRGSRSIMLTATEMGYPLYLGMGFREVCRYRTYEPPSSGNDPRGEGAVALD